jgi:hypothetical protein
VTIATMMKKSLFNKLLLTLTVFDTLFIFNGGIFMAQQSLDFKNEVVTAGLPDFFLGPNIPKNGENIPNDRKLYQTAINYNKKPKNIPNGNKV